MSLPKKLYFFRETQTSPLVPFRVKFRPLRRLFRPSLPLTYSLSDNDDCHPVEAKWDTDEDMRTQDCGYNENEIFTNLILLMKQIDLKR